MTFNSKSYAVSKTVILNVLLTAGGVVQLLIATVSEWSGAGPILTAAGLITLTVGILNVVLRIWFTNAPTTAPFLPARHNLVAQTQIGQRKS